MPKSNNPYDLINALEDKCKEFNMTACSDISAAEDVNDSASESYIDVDGVFGVPGNKITWSQIVDYWNNNCDDDPVLAEYPDFNKWWAETKTYLTPVESCDDVTAAKVVDDKIIPQMSEDVMALWDTIVQYHIASEDELKLVTGIFGATLDNLNKIIHYRTGYDDIDTYLEEVYPEE